jgi:hypothetical protein
MSKRAGMRRTRSQRGMSIFIVALGLMLLVGIAGLSVDLASLYVARNEAQRAADAAALAGAEEFIGSGYTSGLVGQTLAAQEATQHAAVAGNQNLVLGRTPGLDDTGATYSLSCPPPAGSSGVCFNFTTTNDPQITVVVYENMPTYFMKVFGVASVPVSVKATAETYNPAGGAGPTTSVQCLKPWLLPNCDFDHTVPSTSQYANANCGSAGTSGGVAQSYEYFVNPNNNDAIVNPGLEPTGAIGEELQIKPGTPGDAEAPSKFWPVFLPAGTYTCPACASNDVANSTSNSAALYRENIECCSTNQIACGETSVQPIGGNMVGPTGQGVQCLIHESNNGSGQDCISIDTSPTCAGVTTSLALPFTMYAGANNPYGAVEGSQITTSDSLITIPLYDGSQLCPGNSSSPNCPSSIAVDVVGFMQMFIQSVGGQNQSVWAYVLNISGCGAGAATTGTGGTPPAVPVYTGQPIPVRLIHTD